MEPKQYNVILADPPWNYANSGCRGAAENHYPTMTLKEICALPVADMAADDSILLLWATWPQLQEGLEVMCRSGSALLFQTARRTNTERGWMPA